MVQLTALELDILDIKMLPRDLFDEKLERYHFCIQDDDGIDDDDSEDDDDLVDGDLMFSASRCLMPKFRHNESSVLQEYGLEMLLKRSQALFLIGLQAVNKYCL